MNYLFILYIDPGTGSLLISSIIGLVITFLFTLKGFFYKIASRFTGKTHYLKNDFTDAILRDKVRAEIFLLEILLK